MNVGIVTTWFERGASYVSKQFEDILKEGNNVYIFARGGEQYAVGDPKWDRKNVTWAKKRKIPFSGGGTVIEKNDFISWIKNNKIEAVLFNEQEWLYPLLWCDELRIPSIGYVDYYKKETVPLFNGYTSLICNTKRHYSIFKKHSNCNYVPWGTNVELYKPINTNFELVQKNKVTFFHSCGMDPYRKGTDLLITAASKIDIDFKLIIHTQIDIDPILDEIQLKLKNDLLESKRLEIIKKTVTAPGLYHLGDVYIYPSRLEGIGLTIAEAQASGLVPLVTNNGPMNEFIADEIGYLIDVNEYYSRFDAYYWPECTPDVDSLAKEMTLLGSSLDKIPTLKKRNYEYANSKLDWSKNRVIILKIFSEIKYSPLTEETKRKILEFENNGFRKITLMYLRYYHLSSLIYRFTGFVLKLIGLKTNSIR
jgi:glycosyltransferase involved in cell wall biosynthesis